MTDDGGAIDRLRPGETERYFEVDGAAFGHRMPPAIRSWVAANMDTERILCSRNAGEIVGTAASEASGITVPGLERVSCSLVVAVAVAPSHRRQGRMARLMRAQLDELRDGGEVLTTLFASEGGIYGRFGYGMATFGSRYEVDLRLVELRPEVIELASGRTRLVQRDEAASAFAEVYRRYAPTRAGEVERSELGFWNALSAPASDELPKRFFVLYEEAGRLEGYASYEVVPPEGSPGPGVVVVHELCAASTAAYVGVWKFLFGVDLTVGLRAGGRPVDEDVRFMLTNPRLLRTVMTQDRSWLRLVDVERALSGRRYGLPGRLVLGVRDAFCPWNEGSYRLVVEAEWEQASVERTEDEPDLEMDVTVLASAYLGGVRPSAFALTSAVTEHEPGSLATADRMFANERPPATLTQY